jgi:hypothetical protein
MKIKLDGFEDYIESDAFLDDSPAPPFAKEISSYRYSIFGRPGDNKVIFLYDSSGDRVGRLYFYKKIEIFPPSSLENGEIVINYLDSDFSSVISFLRNEKEKSIIWIDGGNSRLSTGI